MDKAESGWLGVILLLAASWLVVFNLFLARWRNGRKEPGLAPIEVGIPTAVWWLRFVIIVFFTITLGLIFGDPDLHAWALTRYTVWTFVCSLVYLAESQTAYTKIRVRPIVLAFCVSAELVVATGYWSLYADKTYISAQSRLSQFHSTVAHMLIQLVLLVEIIACARRGKLTPIPFAVTLLYLSTYMLAYASAIFVFCRETHSTLPYAIIDPREEGGYVPLWLLLAWFAHGVFCWITTALSQRRFASFADCSLLVSATSPLKESGLEPTQGQTQLLF